MSLPSELGQVNTETDRPFNCKSSVQTVSASISTTCPGRGAALVATSCLTNALQTTQCLETTTRSTTCSFSVDVIGASCISTGTLSPNETRDGANDSRGRVAAKKTAIQPIRPSIANSFRMSLVQGGDDRTHTAGSARHTGYGAPRQSTGFEVARPNETRVTRPRSS